jgi:hypothetical protein
MLLVLPIFADSNSANLQFYLASGDVSSKSAMSNSATDRSTRYRQKNHFRHGGIRHPSVGVPPAKMPNLNVPKNFLDLRLIHLVMPWISNARAE